jgi:SAM-dependent methyltransferase
MLGVGWSKRAGRLRLWARTAVTVARFIREAWGAEPRNCNICGYKGRFHAYGDPPRYDASCPRCGSLERQRQIALWLEANPSDWRGRAVLHFAPDAMLRAMIEPQTSRYIGADIAEAPGCVQLDIQDINLPDDSADLIICSHVLEHVDDARALRELRRVLQPGGVALLMVPQVYSWQTTYEDQNVNTARERRLHFGQDDHVRFYGADFIERVARAGFDVAMSVAREPEVLTYGLSRGETIYIAKPIDGKV